MGQTPTGWCLQFDWNFFILKSRDNGIHFQGTFWLFIFDTETLLLCHATELGKEFLDALEGFLPIIFFLYLWINHYLKFTKTSTLYTQFSTWFHHVPVVYPAILVLVCKLKHLINVLLIDRNRKVPHHKLEISFSERLVLYLPLFCPKIRRIRICPTNNLKCFGSFQKTLNQRSGNLEKCLVKYFLVLLPVLPQDEFAELRIVDEAIDTDLVGHVNHLLLARVQTQSLHCVQSVLERGNK